MSFGQRMTHPHRFSVLVNLIKHSLYYIIRPPYLDCVSLRQSTRLFDKAYSVKIKKAAAGAVCRRAVICLPLCMS